ncbi:Signal transduction histidine kinase [Rhodospirillaceae bacterium LM-1]|nr:Signal transduction histidine kinase [Rhodospirillaceae bacterium LM-1]
MPMQFSPVQMSVARQLMLRLALVSGLFALMATFAAVFIEYRDESSKIEEVFSQIEEGYLGSLTETAWLEDRDRLSLLVMGIARLPNVVHVEVRDPNGAKLSQAGAPSDDAAFRRSFHMTKRYKDRELVIGTLSVYATDVHIKDKAFENALVFGLANLFLVLAASTYLYAIVRGLISAPLGKLTLFAHRLGKGQEETAILVDLEMRHAQNEFGLLVRTLGEMQASLNKNIAELRASEERYRELFAYSPIALWEEDFSPLKERLEALRAQTDNLEAYIDAHPNFVHECASLIRVIDVNNATLRMHGANSKSELLGELSRIFTPASLRGFQLELMAIWNGKNELAFESEVRTLTGETRDVLIHWLVLPASRAKLDRVIVSQEDITERTVARHSLAVTVERLMETNSELERFTHAAAHDLAEPVRGIVSFSQLLERHLSNSYDKEIKDYLGYLVAAAKRMQTQIEGLQEYARIGEGVENREMADLDQLAKQAFGMLREQIRLTQAEIEVNFLPKAFVNADQITDVFRNLIDNAIKFRRQGARPVIRIGAERRDGEWTISVKDNGIGIDPRYASDVFQVFRRLSPPSQATGEGIGLSLCRRVIERHGGRMWLESALGQGSTFYFTLPASEGGVEDKD